MRSFDRIFLEEGRGLPLSFLRALAYRESRNNPKQATGPAWGLLQVGISKGAGNVLKSYNQRFKTTYTKHDMLDPRINVRVASELLARIVKMLIREGLEPNWQNGNWIGVLTAAWNAGYSYKAGVLKVVRWLKKEGIPITLSAVYHNVKAAGGGRGFVKRMNQQKRRKWHRAVVASTFKEQGIPVSLEAEGKKEWLPLLLLALLLR